MATLKFTIRPDEDDPFRGQVIDVLSDFLQPNSGLSRKEAARTILHLLPDDDPESPSISKLGGTCIVMAKEIPYHHQSLVKLAALIEILASNAKLSGSFFEDDLQAQQKTRWERLGWSLRDHLNGRPDPNHPTAYVSFHAFTAILWGYSLPYLSSPTWPIWAMRDAHEQYRPRPGEAAVRSINVMAAAQWIIWYGQRLFQQLLYPGDVDENLLRMWRPGPAYTGKGELDLDRWHFWRDGFDSVASSATSSNESGTGGEANTEPDYATECQRLARRAATMMDAIEASMTF